MQNLCNINLVCTRLFIILKKCKTFATSSGLQMPNFFLIFSLAFSASEIPSLRVGKVKMDKIKRLWLWLDYILEYHCHCHRDHISQDYGNDKTDLIRLVSTKFGQTHWTITPVLAKLILFWDEVVEKEWGEMGIQIHPMTGKTCSFMLSLFVRLCYGNKDTSKLTPRLRVSAMTPCFATM